ncbi:MAG: hypothetical protein INH41_15690 [Myxococcaceae bacterium]|jgi:hypothetical protein|nr:hypothetical protein [Myxococcaceae bacterium]
MMTMIRQVRTAAAASAGPLKQATQAAQARLRNMACGAMQLNNLSDYILQKPPDTSGLTRVQAGNNEMFIDTKSKTMFVHAGREWWAGPVPMTLNDAQKANVKSTITFCMALENRVTPGSSTLGASNPSDHLLKTAPDVKDLTSFDVSRGWGSARQVAYVDFENSRFFVREQTAGGKASWLGPLWLRPVGSVPR